MDWTGKTQRAVLAAGLLTAVTLAGFWPVLHNGFVNFDDPPYVTANLHVRTGLSWGNVAWAFRSNETANWHPLTWLSHMLDAQLFGLRANGHHLVSLFFHIANALLLFIVLRRMTGAEWRSAFVAGFFAVHPLHVESVAWVAERKDVLSTFFFMLTLWAYARYARKSRTAHHASGTPHDPSRFTFHVSLFYGLSLLCFTLGLLSKPMLVTLPFLLVLLDYWPLQRYQLGEPGSLVPLLWEKIPFLGLAAAFCALTFWVQQRTQAVTVGLPLALRVENAVVSYVKYLGKTFWPMDLAVFYQHPEVGYFALHHDALHPASDQWPGWQIGVAALLLVLITLAALLRLKRQPWFTVGWFWFLGTLVPVIGIIQAGSQALADRYTYIPLIGVFICVVWGASELCAGRWFGPKLLAITGSLGVAVCVLLTHRQAQYWRDDLTLFEHALAVTGKNATAHYQIGLDLEQMGKYDLALRHYQDALDADPTMTDAYLCQVNLLERLGHPEEALKRCQAALQAQPWLEWAHNRICALLWKLGRREEARQQCLEALRFNPRSAEAHYNLGIALSDRGDLAEAATHLAEAVRLKPDYGEAIIVLAEVLLKQGRPAEAEACFRQALAVDPTSAEAHLNLGGLLWGSGRSDEAFHQYAQAIRLSPTQPMAHYNMGSLLFAQGKLPEAAVQLREALRLKPDYPEATMALSRVLVAQGRLDEALVPLQAAVRESPTNVNLQVSLGHTLMSAGHTNEAKACFANALRLEPGLAASLTQAGKSLAARGQLQAAIGRFRTVVYLTPEDPAAHATLDMAYAEAGRFDDAIRAAEKTRALALSMGDQDAVRAAEARLPLYRKQQPFHQ
jgi:protein O-mannosyl-transferase